MHQMHNPAAMHQMHNPAGHRVMRVYALSPLYNCVYTLSQLYKQAQEPGHVCVLTDMGLQWLELNKNLQNMRHISFSRTTIANRLWKLNSENDKL